MSYRRDVSAGLAQYVHDDLERNGFDVFKDTQDLDAGRFERSILREIETRTHFVLLLQPRSLDRIGEPRDWLRREIAHALRHDRSIVPVVAGTARMPTALELPDDIAQLAMFNAVSAPDDYLPDAMQKLRNRFLSGAGAPRSAGPPVLTARRLGGRLHTELRWTEVNGAESDVLERSNTPGFGVAPTRYNGRELAFLDRFTLVGSWFYRVRADREDVVGVWSAPLKVW